MTADAPELPREPGWYRPGKGGWEHLTNEQAQWFIDAGVIDLVHVDPGAQEEPLW